MSDRPIGERLDADEVQRRGPAALARPLDPTEGAPSSGSASLWIAFGVIAALLWGGAAVVAKMVPSTPRADHWARARELGSSSGSGRPDPSCRERLGGAPRMGPGQ